MYVHKPGRSCLCTKTWEVTLMYVVCRTERPHDMPKLANGIDKMLCAPSSVGYGRTPLTRDQ